MSTVSLGSQVRELYRTELARANSGNSVTVELEARIGFRQAQGTAVSLRQFRQLKATIDRSLTPITSCTKVVIYNNDLRVITDNSTGISSYETKERVTNFDPPDWDYRISISRETLVTDISRITGQPIKNQRIRQRFSYPFSTVSRLDLTEVMSIPTIESVTDKTCKSVNALAAWNGYEVELEFVGQLTDLDQFEQDLYKLYAIFNRTTLVYPRSLVQKFQQSMNDLTNPLFSPTDLTSLKLAKPANIFTNGRTRDEFMVTARTLARHHLQWGTERIERAPKSKIMPYDPTLLGGSYQYIARNKVDGQRCFLVAHPTGLWLTYPPYEYNLIDARVFDQVTWLDGEYNPPIRAGQIASFVPFDCLINQGAMVLEQNYLNRIRAADSFIAMLNQRPINGFSMLTKSYKLLFDETTNQPIEPDRFFALQRELLDEGQRLQRSAEMDQTNSFKVDGIIYTPNNLGYFPHFPRPYELNPLYKYKNPRDITMDFSIDWTATTSSGTLSSGIKKLILRTFDETRQELVAFGGTTRYPLSKVLVSLVSADGTIDISDIDVGAVVEFELDPLDPKLPSDPKWILRPRLLRPDKSGPNKSDTILANWLALMSPLAESTLRGEDLKLAFAHHNEIKNQLYKRAASLIGRPSLSLIGFGEGGGGDLMKVSRYFSKILAVEPDPDRRAEFLERLSGEPQLRNLVNLVAARAQDTDLIAEAVQDWFGRYDRADVGSFMLSATHLWQTAELLDSVVDTILESVSPTGVIILLFANGDIIEQEVDPIQISSVGAQGGIIELHPPVSTNMTIRDAGARFVVGPRPMESSWGRPVEVKIEGSKTVDSNEYLVHIDDLTLRLAAHGFQMIAMDSANKERFMPTWNRQYCGLFSAVIYQGKSDPTSLLPQVSPVPVPIVTTPVIPYRKGPLTNPLLMIPIDRIESLACTWFQPLVRIGTIGEGSCLIHAVVKAFYLEYQSTISVKDRIDYVATVRRLLAQRLAQENPRAPGFLYWETIANGGLVDQAITRIRSGRMEEDPYDYTIEGLQRYIMNGSCSLGEEIIGFLSDVFQIDIHIMEASAVELYHLNSFYRVGVVQDSCVILALGQWDPERQRASGSHYETIGQPLNIIPATATVGSLQRNPNTNQLIRTKFTDQDSLIKAIKSSPSFQIANDQVYPFDPVAYKLNFVKTWAETFVDWDLSTDRWVYSAPDLTRTDISPVLLHRYREYQQAINEKVTELLARTKD